MRPNTDDEKRQRMAEVLVPKRIESRQIARLVVCDENMRLRVQTIVNASGLSISVQTDPRLR